MLYSQPEKEIVQGVKPCQERTCASSAIWGSSLHIPVHCFDGKGVPQSTQVFSLGFLKTEAESSQMVLEILQKHQWETSTGVQTESSALSSIHGNSLLFSQVPLNETGKCSGPFVTAPGATCK